MLRTVQIVILLSFLHFSSALTAPVVSPGSMSITVLTRPDAGTAGDTIDLCTFGPDAGDPSRKYRFMVRWSDSSISTLPSLFLAGHPVPDTVGYSINDRDTLQGVFPYTSFPTPTLYSVYWGRMDDTLSLLTSLVIKPNRPARITITDASCTPYPDTVTMTSPDQSVTMFASGTDQFGNMIGFIVAKWSRTSQESPVDSARSSYFTFGYEQHTSITIIAGSEDPLMADSICMLQASPSATIAPAVKQIPIRTGSKQHYTLSGRKLQTTGSTGIAVSKNRKGRLSGIRP